MHPDLSLVHVSGEVSVVEVNPLALLRIKAGAPAGAAWKSTKDETWTAWRPDRDGGRVQAGLKGRAAAVAYLAAVVE